MSYYSTQSWNVQPSTSIANGSSTNANATNTGSGLPPPRPPPAAGVQTAPASATYATKVAGAQPTQQGAANNTQTQQTLTPEQELQRQEAWRQYYQQQALQQQQQQQYYQYYQQQQQQQQPPYHSAIPPPPRPPPNKTTTAGVGTTTAKSNSSSNPWQWSNGKSAPQTLNVPPPVPPTSRASVKFRMSKVPAPTAPNPIGKQTDEKEQFISAKGTNPSVKRKSVLSHSHPVAKKPTQQSTTQKYPASLKAYATKAFAQCETNDERDIIEKKLKAEIQKAQTTGQYNDRDWSTYPIPRLKSPPPPQSQPPQELRASPDKPNTKPPPGYLCKICHIPGHYILHCPKYIPGGHKAKKQKTEKAASPPPKKISEPAISKAMSERLGTASLQDRALRFADTNMLPKQKKKKWTGRETVAPKKVIGTCQDLEKQYLRLTSAPDPAMVRPPNVLNRALEHVIRKYKDKTKDYKWFSSQMKAIRQDLTVQGVRNTFTVKVYETHARVALEQSDNSEFNQCQTQLLDLYDNDVKGSEQEFVGYRILYNVFVNSEIGHLAILSELNDPACRVDPSARNIKHALKVYEAFSMGNYAKFFKLYDEAPLMGGYLMDMFVEKERKKALLKITQAYRPSIPINHIRKVLAFESLEDCVEFLKKMEVSHTPDCLSIDCKESVGTLLQAQKTSATGGLADWAK